MGTMPAKPACRVVRLSIALLDRPGAVDTGVSEWRGAFNEPFH